MSTSERTQRQEQVLTASPEETEAVAGSLVARLEGGAVLALHGDLGSGKTCFVQGIARALGILRPVTSPTFTIINEYRGRLPLYHVDLYRLNRIEDLLSIGFDEYLDAGGFVAIEWAERADPLLPAGAVHVRLDPLPEPGRRRITILWPSPQPPW
jgi:tRNA threonylcarbamoyladenosine biosynthesis protein TsaE